METDQDAKTATQSKPKTAPHPRDVQHVLHNLPVQDQRDSLLDALTHDEETGTTGDGAVARGIFIGLAWIGAAVAVAVTVMLIWSIGAEFMGAGFR